jgi:thioredoxin-related protein
LLVIKISDIGGHFINCTHFLAMLKKSLLTIGATLLFASVLFLIYGIVEKVSANEMATKRKQILTAAPFFTIDSTYYEMGSINPLLLIHFNSECDQCQNELAELKRNLAALQTMKVLLMSSENISKIKILASEFSLEQFSNVDFVKINRNDVYENFGSLATPHIFIYGKDRKLIKEFRGETKMEAILQYLPK